MKRNTFEVKDIFISWNNRDRRLKNKLVRLLKFKKYSVWESDSHCTGSISEACLNQISKCHLFIVLLTENSIHSEWVLKECKIAINGFDEGVEKGSNKVIPIVISKEDLEAQNYGVFGGRKMFKDTSIVWGYKKKEILKKVEILYSNALSYKYKDSLINEFRIKNFSGFMPLTNISNIYIDRTLKDKENKIIEENEFLNSNKSGIIIAKGGLGKTSFVQSLVNKDVESGNLYFVLEASKFSRSNKSLYKELYELFKTKITYENFKEKYFNGLLIHKNEYSKICIIIDGLDEVQELSKLDEISKKLTEFIGSFKNTRVIMTSRVLSHANYFSFNGKQIDVYNLEGLDTDLIKKLIHNLFEASKDADFISFKNANEDEFYASINELNEDIKSNPLLVTQLAFIYAEDLKLPKTQIEILDRVTDIVVRRVDETREFDKNIYGNLNTILKEIAYHKYMNSSLTVMDILTSIYGEKATSILNYITRRAIIVKDNFSHKMFIEYFTASYLYDDLYSLIEIKSEERLINLIKKRYNNEYWKTVIELLICKIDNKSTSEIFEETLNLISQNVNYEFDLLFNISQVLQNKELVNSHLVSYLIDSTLKKEIPYYGHLLYYVHNCDLYSYMYEQGVKYLEDNNGIKVVSLLRDIPYIMCKGITISDFYEHNKTIKKYKEYILKSGKSYRNALNAIFYECEVEWLEDEINKSESNKDIHPYFMNLYCVSKRNDISRFGDCKLLKPFNDELDMYSNDTDDYNDKYIGLVVKDYNHQDIEEELEDTDTSKMVGLILNPTKSNQFKQLKIDTYSVSMLIIPSTINEVKEYSFIRYGKNIKKKFNLIYSYGISEIADVNYNLLGDFNIYIPNSVTSIGESAFSGCSSLTSIEIPTSVTSIGGHAFSWCSSLTSIEIPTSVESIGERAFLCCISLTSIEIPKGVISIGEWAFENCNSLTSIIIQTSVKSIGESAFRSCRSLTSIIIPTSVESIGGQAFSFCSSLTSIEIPEGVKSIGGHAFWYCNSLTSIIIPTSVESIGESAFSDCSSLTNFIYNGVNYNSFSDVVTQIEGSQVEKAREYIELYDVKDDILIIKEGLTEISNWYISFLNIKKVIIPTSVESIGEYAFSWCSSLTSIEIPEGVKSIGGHAFLGCSSLTSIEIPKGVTSIGKYVFWSCDSLTSIEIPEGVTSIGESAFSGCSSLTSIIIPTSVESIGEYAFSGCSSLTSIEIPTSVESIGESAFKHCSSLTSIIIPEGVTSIGESAFWYCSSLTSIEIPKGVTSIGKSAFSGCSSLTSIEIPTSVESIGEFAFWHCSSLTSIEIPKGVISIDRYAFERCSSLTSIEIPEGVTSTGKNAFSGCSSLTSIEIPNSVESIGESAFSHCSSLTNIEIPEGVISIGRYAFERCSSLKFISIPISIEFISDSAFNGCKLEFVDVPNHFERFIINIFGEYDRFEEIDDDRKRYYFK